MLITGLPYKLRAVLGLLLFGLLLHGIGEAYHLPSYFRGNLVLLDCLGGYLAEVPERDQRFESAVAPSQKSTIAYLEVIEAWELKNYQELISNCTTDRCSCSVSANASSKVKLHRRLQIYYSILSYRSFRGRFPELEACEEVLVPSSFIWFQALSAREQEWSNVLWELAYLIDKDWGNSWQSGYTAFKQAERYRNQGKLQASQVAFEVAVADFQESSHPRAVPYTSRSLTALGEIALEWGNLNTAELRFRESIKTSPEKGWKSFQGLVHVWSMQDLTTDEMLHRFVNLRNDLGPNDPYLTSSPAQALLKIDAIDASWQFIQTAPHDVQRTAPVLSALGQLHENEGEFRQARQYYSDALSQTLGTKTLEAAARAADLGRVNETLGNVSEAVASLELATQLNPQSAWYWYRLARLYQANGETEYARESLERALSLSPENAVFQQFLIELEN